jgi:hypothetical protein
MACFHREKGRAHEKMIGFESSFAQQPTAPAPVTPENNFNPETAGV